MRAGKIGIYRKAWEEEWECKSPEEKLEEVTKLRQEVGGLWEELREARRELEKARAELKRAERG